MHPPDCPQEWEYDHHPNRVSVLRKALKEIIFSLRNGQIDPSIAVADTRPIHLALFKDLAPEDAPYYAGYYRGEDFRCIKYVQVGVQGDPRVGWPPYIVPESMEKLRISVQNTIAKLDKIFCDAGLKRTEKEKVLFLVDVVSYFFEFFLRIHPYVNGNGHTARFCVWAILGHYGYWIANFPIDPRPPNPPYNDMIVSFRNGDKIPLAVYILKNLIRS